MKKIILAFCLLASAAMADYQWSPETYLSEVWFVPGTNPSVRIKTVENSNSYYIFAQSDFSSPDNFKQLLQLSEDAMQGNLKVTLFFAPDHYRTTGNTTPGLITVTGKPIATLAIRR